MQRRGRQWTGDTYTWHKSPDSALFLLTVEGCIKFLNPPPPIGERLGLNDFKTLLGSFSRGGAKREERRKREEKEGKSEILS